MIVKNKTFFFNKFKDIELNKNERRTAPSRKKRNQSAK